MSLMSVNIQLFVQKLIQVNNSKLSKVCVTILLCKGLSNAECVYGGLIFKHYQVMTANKPSEKKTLINTI